MSFLETIISDSKVNGKLYGENKNSIKINSKSKSLKLPKINNAGSNNSSMDIVKYCKQNKNIRKPRNLKHRNLTSQYDSIAPQNQSDIIASGNWNIAQSNKLQVYEEQILRCKTPKTPIFDRRSLSDQLRNKIYKNASTSKRTSSNVKKGPVGPSSAGSDTLGALEPFQEVVDEALNLDWGELQDAQFSMEDVNIDKPAATQAVAFVIRASRRGVVPLCAEVATLLKEKSDLEIEVEEQKQKIEELENAVVNLRGSMAKPPPITRDFCLQTVQEMETQTDRVKDEDCQTEVHVVPCVKDEVLKSNTNLLSISFTESYKDKDDEATVKKAFLNPPGVQTACGSNIKMTCSCHSLQDSATQQPGYTSIGVNTIEEDCMDSMLGYFEHKSLLKSHDQLAADKVDLIQQNSILGKNKDKINDDLDKAKKEILTLQRAIQELQGKEYERLKLEEELRYEDTYSVDVQPISSEESEKEIRSKTSRNRNVKELLPLISPNNFRPPKSSIFPGPILGCKCNMCGAFFRSSGILGFACTPYVTDSGGRNPVIRDLRRLVWLQNSKLQIQPNDEVIAKNNKLGIVRYVGHLDGVGSPSIVYIGLELEEKSGRHDGYFNGKRYFFCPQKQGTFLPIQDIMCVINKKNTPPIAQAPVRSKTESKMHRRKSKDSARATSKSSRMKTPKISLQFTSTESSSSGAESSTSSFTESFLEKLD